jgi:DNA-binding NarL/FixJ family response regulator
MIRVLLADDQVLVRAGFRALLDAQDDIEVVGEAGDGDQAVRLTRELAPDIVLMDIRMPGTDGLAATRQIAADGQLASVRVVILTTFELDEYVFEAVRSGASGFLVKDTEPDELVQAIRVVAGGDALLSPSVTRRLIGEFAARAKEPRRSAGLAELTDREQEVLALVASGMSDGEIATSLVISKKTVSVHVASIKAKLGASSRVEVATIALRESLT